MDSYALMWFILLLVFWFIPEEGLIECQRNIQVFTDDYVVVDGDLLYYREGGIWYLHREMGPPEVPFKWEQRRLNEWARFG